MINKEGILKELTFITSRSSGPGGQNVNKTESRVELSFDINSSQVLSDDQKSLLLNRLSGRINSEGILKLYSQESRSQLKNKQLVSERFLNLLESALKKIKKRIETKPSKESQFKRRLEKKLKSLKKLNRGNRIFPED